MFPGWMGIRGPTTTHDVPEYQRFDQKEQVCAWMCVPCLAVQRRRLLASRLWPLVPPALCYWYGSQVTYGVRNTGPCIMALDPWQAP